MKNFLKNIHTKWYYTFADFISKGSFFVLIFIIAYFLSPEEYAKISLFNSLVTLFFTIISLNLTSSYITKKKFEANADFNKIISTLTSFLLILSIVVALIAIFIFKNINLIYNIPSQLIFLSIIVSIFNIYFDLLITIFIAEKKKFHYLIISIIYSALLFIISVSLLILLPSIGVYALIYARLLILIIITIYSLLFLRKHFLLKLHIDFKLLKDALLFSFPLLLHTISGFILNYLDKFMINGSKNLSDTALYSFSYNLATVVFILALATNKAFIPDFFKLMNEKNLNQINKRIKSDTENLCFLSLLYIVVLGFAYSIFPSAYKETFLISLLLIFNYIIFFGYNIYSNYLFYFSKTTSIFKNTLISGIVSIVLNVFLIEKFSYIGATISTVISFILLFILFYFSAKKVYKDVFDVKYFLKIFGGIGILLLIYYLLSKIFIARVVILVVLVYNFINHFVIKKVRSIKNE